jgi:hypothetical protein
VGERNNKQRQQKVEEVVGHNPEVALRAFAQMQRQRIGDERPGKDVGRYRSDPRPSSGAASATHEFILEPAVEASELASLSAYSRPGDRLWVYRLSQPDRDRLQRLIADAGGASGVAVAAGVDACRRKPLGSAQLPTTTLLQTGSAGFFVVTEDLDLRNIVSERDLAARAPPCGGASAD